MDPEIEKELEEHEMRIGRLEQCVNTITGKVGEIQGAANTIELLVKWVIVPLLVILGALIGVKLAFP